MIFQKKSIFTLLELPQAPIFVPSRVLWGCLPPGPQGFGRQGQWQRHPWQVFLRGFSYVEWHPCSPPSLSTLPFPARYQEQFRQLYRNICICTVTDMYLCNVYKHSCLDAIAYPCTDLFRQWVTHSYSHISNQTAKSNMGCLPRKSIIGHRP